METPAIYQINPSTVRRIRERNYQAPEGSKALVNEKPLLVIPSLAKALGINGAVLLQQIHYWLLDSEHIQDGKRWVFNSYREWCNQLPWMSIKTMQRTVKLLEEKGLIKTANYNRLNLDRTQWYTIDYDALDAFYDVAKMTNASGQNDKCIESNCPIASGQNDKAIPETTNIDYTEITTEKGSQLLSQIESSLEKPKKKASSKPKEPPDPRVTELLKEIALAYNEDIPHYASQAKEVKELLKKREATEILACWKFKSQQKNGGWVDLYIVTKDIADWKAGRLYGQKGQNHGQFRPDGYQGRSDPQAVGNNGGNQTRAGAAGNVTREVSDDWAEERAIAARSET